MRRFSLCCVAGAAIAFVAANVGLAQTLNPIGISVAADAGADQDMPSATEEPEQIDGSGTYNTNGSAGVVSISNWNNLIIDRFKTSDKGQDGSTNPSSTNPPKTQAVVNSAIPLALNDDTGNPSGASVTAWTGAVSYAQSQSGANSGYTYTNPDAQLNNGYIGDANGRPASITISLPTGFISAGYNVYVYFNVNGGFNASEKGIVSLFNGGNTTNVTGTTNYYVTMEANTDLTGTKPNQTLTYVDDSSSTNSSTYATGNYVNIPVAAGASPSSITVNLGYGTGSTGNEGIAAIELVPVPEPTSLALLLLLCAAPAAWLVSRRRRIAA